MFPYWNCEGGVRIIFFAQVVPVPYSVKSSVISHSALSVCKCFDSPSITICKGNQNTQVIKIK